MDENNIKIIQDRYNLLPKKMQEFVFSDYVTDTVLEISNQHTLNQLQFNSLEKGVLGVLMGLIDESEFKIDIQKESGLENITLDQVTEAIKTRIFSKVEDLIQEVRKLDQQENKVVANLDSRFDKLPGNLKEVIQNSNYQSELYKISEIYKLNVTQMGNLDIATTDLLIGATSPEDFPKIIQKNIGLSEEDSKKMVADINSKVFIPIREKLKEGSGREAAQDLPQEDDIELKSHGIEIIREDKPQPVETSPSKMIEGKEEPLEIPAPAPVQKINPVMNLHPLLNQKLSGSVQTVVTKNQYGVNNAPIKPEEVTPTIVAKPSSYPKNADPYKTPID